jgi:uracil-DNA glycosylase family 4
MLIVGLAPGMHGANRTGRPFTGDASGDFLFAALHRSGFASAPKADEARLHGVRITNAVKCLPPGNRPLAEEIGNCSSFLAAEIDALYRRRPRYARVLLCLGGLAHDAVVKVLSSRAPEVLPGFRHGQIAETLPGLFLIDTYHPSRLNTNTGRLTEAMFDQVLCEAGRLLAR